MMRARYLVLLPLAVILVACQADGMRASHAASLNQDISLAPREQAVFAQLGLNVQFIRVVADSRCPRDATCFWAGDVTVQLSTRIAAAEAVQHEIGVGQHATVGALRLVVVQVQPERTVSSPEIAPEEYRVTVRVEQPAGE